MKDYPEPKWTAKNINRKRGDTTLKQCGWCEYAEGGSARYNCLLWTSCGLIPTYEEYNKDLHWDTECIVMKLGKFDFNRLVENKEYKIEEAKNTIERAKEKIKTLKGLIQKEIPCLPNNRPADYFNNNDIVYVFYKNKWARGIIVSGYRSHDGCVSYILDDYSESQPKNKGAWGCGISVPIVIKQWEYDYFKDNLKAFKIWLDFSDREYNGKGLFMGELLRGISKNKS